MAVTKLNIEPTNDVANKTALVLTWSLLVAVSLFFMYQNRGMQLDDALIYARYIENALAGHGLVYNEGVRFNGLTSPLFSYLVLAVALLVGDALLAGFLVSGLSFLLAALVMGALAHDIARERRVPMPGLAAWCVAALILFMPYFYLTYGMETGLFTLLSALLLRLMRQRSYQAAGVCAALLFLTRSEGALLILVVGINDLMSHRRLPPFRFMTYVAPILIVAVSFGFNAVYYGAAMPETGMAKIWQGQSGLWGEGPSFLEYGYLFEWVARGQMAAVAVLLAAALVGVVALGVSYLNRVAISYLFLYGAFYIAFLIPNYHWYYSPFFVFLCFYAGYGFAWLAGRVSGRFDDVIRPLFVAVLLLPLAWLLVIGARINSDERGGFVPYRDVGTHLREIVGDDESVAMVEIGTVGYYSRRTIVDILGLVNSDNARFIGERHFDAWLDLYHPEYLFVHEPLWDHEVSLYGAGMRSGVREECGFRHPGYRLFRVDESAAGSVETCDPAGAFLAGQVIGSEPFATAAEAVGHVDSVRIVGNFLVLRGWARGGDGAYGSLTFAAPGATGLLSRRLPRQDVADHFENARLSQAGFEAVVRFSDHAAAVEAAAHTGCLMASGDDPMARGPIHWHDGCRMRSGS